MIISAKVNAGALCSHELLAFQNAMPMMLSSKRSFVGEIFHRLSLQAELGV